MRVSVPVILTAVALLACRAGPVLDTQTFDLKYLRGEEAAELIGPYVYGDRRDAKGVFGVGEKTITVRETRDNRDKIARVLAPYDRPRPLVPLTFHPIQADVAAPTGQAIADGEATLREVLRFP